MNKQLLTIFAIFASIATFANNNWFEIGSIPEYVWPETGAIYEVEGGTWSSTDMAQKENNALVLVDSVRDLVFTPSNVHTITDDKQSITATILFTPFNASEIPMVPYNALGALIVVREVNDSLAYYGAASNDDGSSQWVALEGATPIIDTPVEVSITVRDGYTSYTVNGKRLAEVDAYNTVTPQCVSIGGSGQIFSLAGTISPIDNDVPTIYTKIESAIAYTNQYFSTCIYAKSGIAAELDLSIDDNSGDFCLLGAKNGDTILELVGVQNGHWVYGASTDGTWTDTGITATPKERHTIKTIIEDGLQKFYVDGTLHSEKSLAFNSDLGLQFYLFASNTENTPTRRSPAHIYRAKLYRKR